MVVEVPGCRQFARPVIEPFDTGLAAFRSSEAARIGKAVTSPIALLLEPRPDRRAHLQPPLPIGPPQHFLDEFVGALQALVHECAGHHFAFGQQAIAQIGG